jgi:hypothetical protein
VTEAHAVKSTGAQTSAQSGIDAKTMADFVLMRGSWLPSRGAVVLDFFRAVLTQSIKAVVVIQ